MKKNISKVILSLSFIMIITANAFSQATYPGSELGQTFFTVENGYVTYYPNGANILVKNQYRLQFQTDRNLVLYNNNSPIWSSGNNGADRIDFSANGRVQQFASGWIVWEGQVGHSGSKSIWVLQSDGNFVGYDNYEVPGAGVLLNPSYVVTGNPFAATGTAGGKKNSKKRLN